MRIERKIELTSKQKQRMSDIKKRKKAREKKRKKTMRIVFAAAAIVIIGAIVIGVKSCGGQKNQNPAL